jgi:hypothetical protein
MKKKQSKSKINVHDDKNTGIVSGTKSINEYLGLKVFDHPEYVWFFYHLIFHVIKMVDGDDIPKSRFQYEQLEDGSIRLNDDLFEAQLLEVLNDDFGFASIQEDSDPVTRSEALLELKIRIFHLGALLALVVNRFRKSDEEEIKDSLKNFPGLDNLIQSMIKIEAQMKSTSQGMSVATNELKESAIQSKAARNATSEIMNLKIRIVTSLSKKHPQQKINPKDLSKLPDAIMLEARKTAEAFIGNNPKKTDMMKELFRTPKKARKIPSYHY